MNINLVINLCSDIVSCLYQVSLLNLSSVCSDIYLLSKLTKVVTVDSTNYHTLRKSLLKNAEQVSRYIHHIVFISTYVKFNCIPRGFQIRHHNNMEENQTSSILKKCSRKLMLKTIQTYKQKLKVKEKHLKDTQELIKEMYPHKDSEMTSSYNQRVNNICKNLSSRRERKFERDGLVAHSAQEFSSKLFQSLTESSVKVDNKEALKNEILAAADIPSFEPINLVRKGRDLPSGLSDLCSKGPSFVPTPDWLQLQKDFDKFRNNMRSRVSFQTVRMH